MNIEPFGDKSFQEAIPAVVIQQIESLPAVDHEICKRVFQQWSKKTKPKGSLGRLEHIVEWMAGVKGTDNFHIEEPVHTVFIGSHGVTEEKVSAYPDEVNAQMLDNFKQGGAAISVLCKTYGITLDIVDTGIEEPTANITQSAAMQAHEACNAFMLGWNAVPENADLYSVGEMGIGNTTIATAIFAALTGKPIDQLIGPGAGADEAQLMRKRGAIEAALKRHGDNHDAWHTLCSLGGKEIAAMCGAILHAAVLKIPIVLDGAIASAAASIAFELQPNALEYCIAGHQSSEPLHAHFLEHYNLKPLLDLEMRLGEGTGAAMAIVMIRGALKLYHNMASFEEAGITSNESS